MSLPATGQLPGALATGALATPALAPPALAPPALAPPAPAARAGALPSLAPAPPAPAMGAPMAPGAPPSPLDLLRKHWSHAQFRRVQEAAIAAALAGRDVFVRMATGGGKSICFQVAGLMLPGTTIVVSPLISLMQDQVAALKGRGIAAGYLGSQADEDAWQPATRGALRFLYIMPETAMTERFGALLGGMPCALLAIDEAHCVSEWGHDFQPAYTCLHTLRELLPGAAVMALTATATPEARLDVARNLRLRDDHFDLRTLVDRPNLRYHVLPKPPGARARDALLRAVAAGRAMSIVYVPTTREVDEVHEGLQALGVASRPYHAKLPAAERTDSHARFSAGEVRVIVATLAFGMGIDQPDVRRVFHWGPPKSVEAYYQQSGCAGRDGQPADCLMWVSPADWCKVERIALSDSSQPDRDRRSVRALRDYCEAASCRRQRLAAYFGESVAPCGVCDACAAARSPSAQGSIRDATEDARRLLQAARDCGGYVGLSTMVACLRGDCAKYAWLASKPSYGTQPRAELPAARQLAMDLRVAGLLCEEARESKAGHLFSALRLTPLGEAWLAEAASAFEQRGAPVQANLAAWRGPGGPGGPGAASGRTGRGAGAAPPPSPAGGEGRELPADSALYDDLVLMRARLASGTGAADPSAPGPGGAPRGAPRVPAFMVFSNATLRAIAQKWPRTAEELHAVPGVGRSKLDRYGAEVLRCVGAAPAAARAAPVAARAAPAAAPGGSPRLGAGTPRTGVPTGNGELGSCGPGPRRVVSRYFA